MREKLILCLVNALLGNISPHVKAICFDWVDREWIKLQYYLDIGPDEAERELISITLTEFETNLQTENIKFSKYLDEVIHTNEPFNQLDHFKTVVYWRSELPVF